MSPPPPAADGSGGHDTISPMLDEITKLFAGSFEITITPAGNTGPKEISNARKLGYLAARDRDFLAITPQLESAAARAMTEALDALIENALPIAGAIKMVGEGVLDHIVERFQKTTDHGPPDVSMNPLRPSTIERKGHAQVGIDTGHLSHSMADARVVTRKVG